MMSCKNTKGTLANLLSALTALATPFGYVLAVAAGVMLSATSAIAIMFGGVEFPQGAASFADSVVS